MKSKSKGPQATDWSYAQVHIIPLAIENQAFPGLPELRISQALQGCPWSVRGGRDGHTTCHILVCMRGVYDGTCVRGDFQTQHSGSGNVLCRDSSRHGSLFSQRPVRTRAGNYFRILMNFKVYGSPVELATIPGAWKGRA